MNDLLAALTPGVATADLLLRLCLAAVLGGVIGLERELSGKPAGLRTNMLICVGAALLTDLSIHLSAHQGAGRTDPARIAAQIVSGVGFLGAGTIIQTRANVVGLTTAATLWVVAAIGMAAGAGAYPQALATAGVVFLVLVVLTRLEKAFTRRRACERYRFTLDADPGLLAEMEKAFRDRGLKVSTEPVGMADGRVDAVLEVGGQPSEHYEVLRALLERPGIHRMSRRE